MLYALSHTALSLLLLAVAAVPPTACREPQARPAECTASDRLSPEVVLDKVAREHGLTLKVAPHTARILDLSFTE